MKRATLQVVEGHNNRRVAFRHYIGRKRAHVLRKCIATSIVNISKLRVVSRGKLEPGSAHLQTPPLRGNKQRGVAD